MRPASGSSRRPARIAVTAGAAGGCAAVGAATSSANRNGNVVQAVRASVRAFRPARRFSMALKLPGGAAICRRRPRFRSGGQQRGDHRLRFEDPGRGGCRIEPHLPVTFAVLATLAVVAVVGALTALAALANSTELL